MSTLTAAPLGVEERHGRGTTVKITTQVLSTAIGYQVSLSSQGTLVVAVIGMPSCDMTLDSTSSVVVVGCLVEPVPKSLVDALSDSLRG